MRDALIIVIFSSSTVFPWRTEASQRKHGAGGKRTARAGASPSPGTWTGGEDENRAGFSRLMCIHFMGNGKTKHLIFLLFLDPRRMVFLLGSQS